jgi:hypothetical protein
VVRHHNQVDFVRLSESRDFFARFPMSHVPFVIHAVQLRRRSLDQAPPITRVKGKIRKVCRWRRQALLDVQNQQLGVELTGQRRGVV